jgi:hypothetical protein
MRLFLNMNAHSEPPVDLFAGFEGVTAESHLDARQLDARQRVGRD